MSRAPQSVLYKVVPMDRGAWIITRSVLMGRGQRGGKMYWLADPHWHNPGFTDEMEAETAANNLQAGERGKIPALLPRSGPMP